MTPDGKTFDPETVTDKQLVQYEQAIDRGLTEADAIRLTEHEYNGFQANAIIAAALNPAVGEDVLDALATPKYTAAQMTAIAKIAIRGGDFARFLDPQMDARRMEAAYLVVAHGGSDLPVERLSRSQLLTINNILLRGHIPYETVRAIAKPAFTPESMEVIAAAMENARHDPYTGEHSLTEAQVARIMNPEYRPEQQIALLTAMRGQTPVADLSDADFAGLFPASLSVEQMSACAYAVNRCGYNTPLLMMTMQACADMNAQQLMAVFDATAAEFSDATMAKVSTILMHTPALTSQQMRYVAEYDQYLWVPSKYRRNSDGMKPADRKGLVGSEDFALLCWDSVNHLPAIRRISLKASLTSRLIDFKYLREAEAPAYTHGVPNDTFDYEFDDDDDDIPAFSFPEA